MVERGITCNLTKSVLMTPMLIEEEDKIKTVIDKQKVCDRVFATKRPICNNWVRRKINDSPVDREGLSALQKDAERAFEQLDEDAKVLWKLTMREHSAKRPAIEAALIGALPKNNSASRQKMSIGVPPRAMAIEFIKSALFLYSVNINKPST